jgi:TonB family protein
MSNKPQDAGSTLGIAERRLHARRHDTFLAYVEIGESNGGIILNISEGGLVLTAAEPLPDDRLPRMRFQLPGSRDWIEASGQVAWISESRREAGVRFVDISDDARNRIKSWISSEPSAAESQREASGAFDETKQASNSLPAEASANASSETPAAAALPEVRLPDSMSASRATLGALNANQPTTGPAFQDRPAVSDNHPHVENPIPKPDRRRHPRRRDISLAYIDLGGDNGGIILNISESGLVLAAAAPLQGERLPNMRFQLPEGADWIEASGEIAWISESKREAGVRFLTMRDEDRERIRTWVSSETASRESQRVTNKSREKGGRLLEMPAPRGMKSASPPPAEFGHAAPDFADASSAPRSARGMFGAMASAAAAAPAAPAVPDRRLPDRTAVTPEVNVPDQPVQVVVQRRSWRSVAAIVVLASAASFVAGWFAAGPATRSQMLRIFEKSASDRVKTAASAASPSINAGGSAAAAPVERTVPKANAATPPPARTAAAAPSSPTPNANPPARAAERPSPTVAANLPSSRPDKPRAEEQLSVRVPSGSAANFSQRPVENAPAQIASNTPASSKETVSAQPSPIVSQPEVARSAGAAPTAIPPAPAPTVQPEVFKGTVTVSFSPYPSIRVPAELKSQMSRQGASLQIGRLSSRVDPAYPADAERQRIEGTVRVHAIIGRDGAVQSVALISGTSLLAQAVTNAVLQWRYQPTSIGGQAVEAEEDVIVVFKMVSQASRPN